MNYTHGIMTQRRAVIDIGTNTAHLLIAAVEAGKISEAFIRNRHYTYLGEDGLDLISPPAIDRLFIALEEFHDQIKKFQVQHVQVLATDALRSARNGKDIQHRITKEFNWTPKIISGQQEASYIAKGVRQSFDQIPNNYLIMDIGGGSVEFILISHGEEIHLDSLPIGISRLHNFFTFSDPPSQTDIQEIRNHILKYIETVYNEYLKLNAPITLVGSAGTFETFLSKKNLDNKGIKSIKIDTDEIMNRYKQVTTLPTTEWGQLTWLPKARQAYIIAALILIQTTIELCDPEEIIVSKFALKEGAIVSANGGELV